MIAECKSYLHLFRVSMPQGYMLMLKEISDPCGYQTLEEVEDHVRYKVERGSYVANILDCSVSITRYDAEKDMLLIDEDMIFHVGAIPIEESVGAPDDPDNIPVILESIKRRRGIDVREMMRNKSLPLTVERK